MYLKKFLAVVIFIVAFFSPYYTFACTMAVISGKATTDGRPLLLKLRDERDEYRQEVKYYKPKDSEKYGHMSVVKWGFNKNSMFPPIINGAGVNDTGFTISNTTVSDYNIFAEGTNSNIDLINYAITRCKTLEEFESILNNWHKIKKFTTINGNFAVIDAYGKTAMYEAYAPIQGAKIIWEKFDPNNAYDEDGNFLGFVVRTNDNQWSPFRGGHLREARLNDILKELKFNNDLNYKTLMQKAARDVCGDITNNILSNYKVSSSGIGSGAVKDSNVDVHNFNTEGCISKYNTRFGFIAIHPRENENEKLLTVWISLGEPDVGVFTPYFPLIKKVPLYSWADPESNNNKIIDENSSSILNELIARKGKLSVYDNLKANIILGGLVASEEVDPTIDLIKLKEIQSKIIPLQNKIIDQSETFLKKLGENKNLITNDRLYEFSKRMTNYLYENY
jgi:hypothetical protein